MSSEVKTEAEKTKIKPNNQEEPMLPKLVFPEECREIFRELVKAIKNGDKAKEEELTAWLKEHHPEVL